jgi:hypothetical protein
MKFSVTDSSKQTAKAVPLHVKKTLGGRGSIAPTHSLPRDWVGVCGQRHAPAAVYPQREDLWYPLDKRLGDPQSWSGHRG